MTYKYFKALQEKFCPPLPRDDVAERFRRELSKQLTPAQHEILQKLIEQKTSWCEHALFEGFLAGFLLAQNIHIEITRFGNAYRFDNVDNQ